MHTYCGFDFGTSNTVVTLEGGDHGGRVFSEPSVIFLPDSGFNAQERYVGKRAVEEYLASGMDGRFIQSIKSALSDPGFTHTMIHGKRYTIEEIVAMILRSFQDRIEETIGEPLQRAVFGRPVRFHASPERDALAERRLAKAAERAGFTEITFLPEPVAAAYSYRRNIQGKGTVLTGDFGGGTSDFSVLRIDGDAADVLATTGVKVGGDSFDGRIMWYRLVRHFGHGSEYESWGKYLPVPVQLFTTLCTWERIPFLKTAQYRRDLKYIRSGAKDRAAIDRLIALIDANLGFKLFQAIREAKHDLSEREEVSLRFSELIIYLDERIERIDFEGMIAEEMEKLTRATNQVLEEAGVAPEEITHVFLTGGSSMVPLIRTQFRRTFSEAEFTADSRRFDTVSAGLALHARTLN